jgi:hypothetical protein
MDMNQDQIRAAQRKANGKSAREKAEAKRLKAERKRNTPQPNPPRRKRKPKPKRRSQWHSQFGEHPEGGPASVGLSGISISTSGAKFVSGGLPGLGKKS